MPLLAAEPPPQAQKERPPARPAAHDAGWPPHALKAATRAAQSIGLSPEAEPTVPFKKQHVTGLWGRGGVALKRVGCRPLADGEARCEGVGAGEGWGHLRSQHEATNSRDSVGSGARRTAGRLAGFSIL